MEDPYFFRLGRCVSAEPEEVFAVLLEPLLRRVFEAADAARFEVTLVVFRCDRAEPAADFSDLLDLLSLRTREAADAALLLVFSVLLAIFYCLHLMSELLGDLDRGSVTQHKERNQHQQGGKEQGACESSCQIHTKLRPEAL